MQFCRRAYGNLRGFVKDIFVGLAVLCTSLAACRARMLADLKTPRLLCPRQCQRASRVHWQLRSLYSFAFPLPEEEGLHGSEGLFPSPGGPLGATVWAQGSGPLNWAVSSRQGNGVSKLPTQSQGFGL